MSEADAAGALRETMWLMIKLGGPLLGGALVVGLLVSLVQAVTQINEPTLVFFPKLVVLGASMAVLGPFMAEQMAGFTHLLMDRLVSVGGR